LEDFVGDEALNSDLSPKLRLVKKIPFISFPSHLLKIALIKSTFFLTMLPHHKGAKQNTIGVIKITNVKLPHHKSLVPTYPMENKMPLVHNIR
jgi:hypothetical protein